MSDELLEKIFAEQPLLKFSLYVPNQVDALKWIGEPAFDPNSALNAGERMHRFWFFILGAYEIIRTMHENKDCFDVSIHGPMERIKAQLADIRMPFAKLQIQGKNKTPIFSELSVVSARDNFSDFTYNIGGKLISARNVFQETMSFFSSIKIEHVTYGLESQVKSAVKIN
ncbi:MAG: hypothetical protein O9322_08520 [Beijerinckiaceae bacterium]|nr:hypothetical protein [Beijerinckiaceae bacterium]MCZ8301156.1 hypothetical protein [Beijerinckiaceae bacterium]